MNFSAPLPSPGPALLLGSILLAATASHGDRPLPRPTEPTSPNLLLIAAAPNPAAATVIKNVKAKEAAKLLDANTNIIVIDVRTPEEFASGHIAGATNINFVAGGFADALQKLDRAKTYLVHCAVGGRSKRSLQSFKSLGFQSIIHLDGGIDAWEASGKPVVK